MVFLPLFLLLVLLSSTTFGQFFAKPVDKCAGSQSCTPLTKCPKLLNLLRSGNSENIKKVQHAICGFEGKRSKVCCDTVPGTTPSGGGEQLLPKNCGRASVIDRILGGEPAPIGAYPWMVALGYQDRGSPEIKFLCAGSVINNRYVLTAAHCVDPNVLGSTKLTVLHLADYDLTNPGLDCQITIIGPNCAAAPHFTAGIESTLLHPLYDRRAISSDDIALIRMNITIDFSKNRGIIQPICLPAKDQPRSALNSIKEEPVAAGWGFTETFTTSDILLRVSVPLNGNDVCQELYGARYVSKQLCVGGAGGRDTCSGDSGGPLILAGSDGPPFTQIGIVSYGPQPCGIDKTPAVYTSVGEYRDWIVNNLKA